MINLDTRLLELLTGEEIAVFIHIVKRIDKKNKCFPSRKLLQKETSFSREKIAKTIQSLISKKIIKTHQENTGTFGRTIYTVLTNLAGVYISAKNEELTISNTEIRDTENRTTEIRDTENPLTENQPLSIKQYLSINQNKKKIYKKDFDFLLSLQIFKKYLKTEKLEIIKSPLKIKATKKAEYIYNQFYDNQIKNNQNEIYIEQYKEFVKFLFDNETGEKLHGILSIKNQLEYRHFPVINQLKIDNKKNLIEILLKMENDGKYTKNKKSLNLTLQNWLRNKNYK